MVLHSEIIPCGAQGTIWATCSAIALALSSPLFGGYIFLILCLGVFLGWNHIVEGEPTVVHSMQGLFLVHLFSQLSPTHWAHRSSCLHLLPKHELSSLDVSRTNSTTCNTESWVFFGFVHLCPELDPQESIVESWGTALSLKWEVD